MRCTLDEWQRIPKPRIEYIYNCSTKDGSDGYLPFTIGIGWGFIYTSSIIDTQIGRHDKLILNAVSPTTDCRRRPVSKNRRSILKTLENNGIPNVYGMSFDKYFTCLPQYKFVISPEGNGVDCHRHYEALMAGCIPIIEKHSWIESKYSGCPILYTEDYTEITESFLNEQYQEMIGKTWDFSRLLLSSYDHDTQSMIKDNGNYWAARLSGSMWYP
jgi:hypothetical protein